MGPALDVSVAFLIFNRPRFTDRVFAAIAGAQPRRLLVVADGPRPDHPEDERLVAQARAVISRVDWPCEVLTNYSDVNLGCGRRIASGLDWVFDSVPEAIILEDDCLPHPDFFPFCEELLERYRSDPRVHMISGANLAGWRGPYSYHFSRSYHIWGWASWRRAWKYYDFEMRDWPRLRETDWLRRHLRDARAAQIAELLFNDTYAGRIRQWDFQWAFSGWLRNAVSIIPSTNLVTNIGFGDAATHLRSADHPFAGLPPEPMAFPLQHPSEVEVCEEADRAAWDRVAARYPQLRRSAVERATDYVSRFPRLVRRLGGSAHADTT